MIARTKRNSPQYHVVHATGEAAKLSAQKARGEPYVEIIDAWIISQSAIANVRTAEATSTSSDMSLAAVTID